MKQIEITTAQHVTIRYTLATVMDRILAFALDILIVSSASGLLIFLYSVTGIFRMDSDMYLFFSVYPLILFYHLVMESFGGGRSFGKKVLRIKPVKKNGSELTFMDYLMRWIFRLPDVLMSLGSMAVIMISSSSAAQRLGDLLADTVVVKTEDYHTISLSRILKMNRHQKNYGPVYPEVRQLSENDILLIKEVSDRYIRYKNDAALEALRELTAKIEETLDIRAPQNKQKFLKELITYYVFLTR